MAVLYMKEQGAYLKKCGQRLKIEKGAKALLEIPVEQIENIAVIGNIQITTQALHLILEKGIDLSYFSYSGKYLGHTAAETSKNIFLRFSQYELYQNPQRRMEFARQIVENKVHNQMKLLAAYRWDGLEYDWKKDYKKMGDIVKTLGTKQTSNELMGVEGICSNIYFNAYGQMFRSKCKFNGRSRRPPKDPVNVIISLGYTFLTKEVSSALEAESFEMYLGFLHGIRYGRKSLPLDLVEEFRQPVIDRFALKMFNKRILNEFDFDDCQDLITLNEEGFKKFCQEYERWMTRKENSQGSSSFRSLIKRQAAVLKRAVLRKEVYQPFAWGNEDVCDQL